MSTELHDAVVTAQAASDAASESHAVVDSTNTEAVSASDALVASTALELTAAKAAAYTTDPLKDNINDLVAKARSDEKSKMYSRVEKLNEAKTASEATILELQEQVSTLIKSQEATPAEDKKVAKEKAPALGQEAIQEMLSVQLKKLEEEVFNPQLTKLSEENKALKAANQKAEIEGYKNKLITSNTSDIISELITGTTKEELDTSLVVAKQAFAKYNKQAAEALSKGINDGAPKTPNLNGIRPTQSETASMSVEQYANSRTEMLAQAAASVAQQLTQ